MQENDKIMSKQQRKQPSRDPFIGSQLPRRSSSTDGLIFDKRIKN